MIGGHVHHKQRVAVAGVEMRTSVDIRIVFYRRHCASHGVEFEVPSGERVAVGVVG